MRGTRNEWRDSTAAYSLSLKGTFFADQTGYFTAKPSQTKKRSRNPEVPISIVLSNKNIPLSLR